MLPRSEPQRVEGPSQRVAREVYVVKKLLGDRAVIDWQVPKQCSAANDDLSR